MRSEFLLPEGKAQDEDLSAAARALGLIHAGRSAFLLPPGFLAALLSPFARWRLAALLSAAGSTLLSALVRFVHGRPGASGRFFFADAALFVTARNLLGLAFLFSRILFLASLCHCFESLPGYVNRRVSFSKIRKPRHAWICLMTESPLPYTRLPFFRR